MLINDLMLGIIFFMFGLVIGSFLNVVILRIKKKKSFVAGRSACLHCKHVLGFWDLIPLFSFLFLRGRCHYCHKKLSWQYFLMEFGTGIVFVLIFFSTNNPRVVPTDYLITLFYLILSCFLIIIFVYDYKYYLILDKITVPAIILAFFGNLYFGISWQSLLIGAAAAGGFFFLQFVVSKGKWIGGGDIRLGVLMGFILGWERTLLALFIAYFIGAIFGIILMIVKRKKIDDQLPFGTFLSIATFICLIYGNQILAWYLQWYEIF